MLGDGGKSYFDNTFDAIYKKPTYGSIGNNIFNDINPILNDLNRPQRNSYYDQSFDAICNRPPLGSPGNLIFDQPKRYDTFQPTYEKPLLPDPFKDPIRDNRLIGMSMGTQIMMQVNPFFRPLGP